MEYLRCLQIHTIFWWLTRINRRIRYRSSSCTFTLLTKSWSAKIRCRSYADYKFTRSVWSHASLVKKSTKCVSIFTCIPSSTLNKHLLFFKMIMKVNEVYGNQLIIFFTFSFSLVTKISNVLLIVCMATYHHPEGNKILFIIMWHQNT